MNGIPQRKEPFVGEQRAKAARLLGKGGKLTWVPVACREGRDFPGRRRNQPASADCVAAGADQRKSSAAPSTESRESNLIS